MFTSKDIWYGGFFELAIEVGDSSTEHLDRAIKTIWEYSELLGPFSVNKIEPENQEPIEPACDENENWPHYYGVAILPNEKRIACGTCCIREMDGPDWLDFYFPMGALSTVYDVGGYPSGSQDKAALWIPEVEKWLADLGLWLSERASFQMALLGFETCGEFYASDIQKQGDIPTDTNFGYLWPENGKFRYLPSIQA